MKNIKISDRFANGDGKCVICEIKNKTFLSCWNPENKIVPYTRVFVDEIKLYKNELTSRLYSRSGGERIIYNNLREALQNLKTDKYNNFNNVYIRKILNK